ncbi:MAG: putative peptidoglycan binding domain-containing protein [Candidatus Tokpelaia sp. JSC188]|nr:MAG: putative peptidoglycan binding domain-containing protein [Candidatus Tokpelaia sp. JSC188]
MSRKRKRKRKRSVKRPRIVVKFSYLIGKFLRWFFGLLLRSVSKNPLFFLGLSLFVLTLGLVGYNALFNQSFRYCHSLFKSHHDIVGTAFSENPVCIDHDFCKLSNDKGIVILTDNLKIIQKKLADLGFYSGDIDGLSGPKTRTAIKRWQQMQNRFMNSQDSLTTKSR